jgi:hypothetical protein
MNVPWEDVKADYARKDAEIEKLKAMNGELEGKLAGIRQDSDDKESAYIANILTMNAELVEALTNLINDIGSKHSIHVENYIGGSTRRALNCAKIVLANSEELNHER